MRDEKIRTKNRLLLSLTLLAVIGILGCVETPEEKPTPPPTRPETTPPSTPTSTLSIPETPQPTAVKANLTS